MNLVAGWIDGFRVVGGWWDGFRIAASSTGTLVGFIVVAAVVLIAVGLVGRWWQRKDTVEGHRVLGEK